MRTTVFVVAEFANSRAATRVQQLPPTGPAFGPGPGSVKAWRAINREERKVSATLPRRAWQRMLSGRRLDLLAPSALDVELEDIALGLSRLVRWNGQTVGEYGLSVAQHSLLVLDIVEASPAARSNRGLCRAALLHDASEFVTADLITPFKQVIGDTYKTVEKRIQEAVHLRFGLPPVLPEQWARLIKRADGDAAFLEAIEVAGFTEAEARRTFRFRGAVRKGTLTPWPAEVARQRFLGRFAALAP